MNRAVSHRFNPFHFEGIVSLTSLGLQNMIYKVIEAMVKTLDTCEMFAYNYSTTHHVEFAYDSAVSSMKEP